MKINRRDLGFILFLVIVLAAIAGYELLAPKRLHGEVILPPKPVQDFTLQSTNGPVTLSSFRGKVVVLYFGYTSCPDVCPVTLATVRQAMDELGQQAEDVQVIFISVDWKRDTPEVMTKYTAHFNPKFIGLSGTEDQINRITNQLGIFYLLNLPNENGFYTVDHTATSRVLDRLGRLKVIWPYGIPVSDMKADLQILLRDKGNAK